MRPDEQPTGWWAVTPIIWALAMFGLAMSIFWVTGCAAPPTPAIALPDLPAELTINIPAPYRSITFPVQSARGVTPPSAHAYLLDATDHGIECPIDDAHAKCELKTWQFFAAEGFLYVQADGYHAWKSFAVFLTGSDQAFSIPALIPVVGKKGSLV